MTDASFQCPLCGFVSHNPNDARERYCIRCHEFVDDVLNATRTFRAAAVETFRRKAVEDPERAGQWLRLAETWERAV